ncbi:unnamed protein product [Blepharisma stoltei]|uniref:Uncharacterized protein n=1 Tax=Blepharisma stoltei TaxID=1481888 RepID=A0AAU9JNM0_9CILI|nr:unnamed protein product [Blepharisma stoltei]
MRQMRSWKFFFFSYKKKLENATNGKKLENATNEGGYYIRLGHAGTLFCEVCQQMGHNESGHKRIAKRRADRQGKEELMKEDLERKSWDSTRRRRWWYWNKPGK